MCRKKQKLWYLIGGRKRASKEIWKWGEKRFEEVQEYTYLDFRPH